MTSNTRCSHFRRSGAELSMRRMAAPTYRTSSGRRLGRAKAKYAPMPIRTSAHNDNMRSELGARRRNDFMRLGLGCLRLRDDSFAVRAHEWRLAGGRARHLLHALHDEIHSDRAQLLQLAP